jgi:2-dehydro-3-deoxyphosphogluconate aldolase/(4S)-4-hydroxy-2-oxoglutarate aldolase
MNATECLMGIRLMPVLALSEEAPALRLAHILRDVGFRALEITLRTPQALSILEALARALPELTIGAGSLRTPTQITQAKAAGAQFLVAPGHTETLLAAAQAERMPFVPGAATGSEMLRLLEAGYELQKFFPAETLGGAPALRSFSAPLPEVRFFPTGGINSERLPAYLALEAVALVGGSWFVSDAALRAGDEEALAAAAAQAWSLAHG